MFEYFNGTFPVDASGPVDPDEGWAPIVNKGVSGEDDRANAGGHSRFTSLPTLLFDITEHGEGTVKFAERRAALDVWIGIVSSLLDMDRRGKDRSWLPKTGGRFLLSGKGVTDQCGHNDFPVRESGSPGYFFLVTGPAKASLHVCPGSHLYVRYHKSRRELLRKSLQMEEVAIPPFSMFIGHGQVQHAGVGWRGSPSLRYHTYISPEGSVLPDAISFSYYWSLETGNGSEPVEKTPPRQRPRARPVPKVARRRSPSRSSSLNRNDIEIPDDE